MPVVNRFLVLAGAAGLAAATFTVDSAGLRAESPLQFFTKQFRQERAASYREVPVRVPMEDPREGLSDLFDSGEADRPREPRAVPPRNLQRVVCRRQCDGAQLVMGFAAGSGKSKQNEAMCAAAGHGAPTKLVVEKFVPGQGFEPPVQTASSEAPLQEGRSALNTNADRPERTQPAGSACPDAAERQAFMTVPILHDATLRNGDVVATKAGFKVFVGKGKPPFKQSDFVDLDSRKRVSADLKKLKISGR